jgi:predicted nucleotidyltransferase
MPALGVIAEYNPFHNGHMLHLRQSKLACGAERAIIVMSGSFVQRGEPAICGKRARTLMALKNGADIVVELPVHYSTASAEGFAFGAVRLLDSLGVATHMSFGTESGDLEKLESIAEQSFQAKGSPEFQRVFAASLAGGMPYFSAWESALTYILRIDRDFIRQPNHILAIEYLKALKSIKSSIIPIAAKRSEGPGLLPASGIRELILRKDLEAAAKYVPAGACAELADDLLAHGPADLDAYSPVFRYLLQAKTPEELSAVQDMGEGLENRLKKAAESRLSISGILKAANTKRYPLSRLRRAALHLVLDLSKSQFEEAAAGPRYIRVLGFRRDAAGLLSEITRKASLPVVLNLKNSSDLGEPGRSMLEKDIWCSDLRHLACGGERRPAPERRQPLAIV